MYLQTGILHPLEVDNLQVEQGGGITGSGDDEAGSYILEGQITKPNTVTMVKTYITGQQVDYRGLIRGAMIEGNWSIDHSKFSGPFFLEMALTDRWKGIVTDLSEKKRRYL